MYKKKDFEFISKYEKLRYKQGTILCTSEWIHIITNTLRESHRMETGCIKDSYFSLDSFLEGYKKVHGSRHLFTIVDDGLLIQTKKTGEEEIVPLEKGLEIKPILPSKKIAIDGSFTFQQFGLLKDISIDMSYLGFLKEATLVLDKDSSYIWKTNGITDVYIRLPSLGETKGYKLSDEICYFSDVNQWNDSKINISLAKNVPGIGIDYLVIYSENDMMAVPLQNDNDYNTYEIPSSSQHYTLTQEELENLQSIKFKKLLAQVKKEKNLKVSYEVYIEIVDGIWYMNGEKFFECSGKVTTRRFEAYKLATFIQNAKEIEIHDRFLKDSNIYFI